MRGTERASAGLGDRAREHVGQDGRGGGRQRGDVPAPVAPARGGGERSGGGVEGGARVGRAGGDPQERVVDVRVLGAQEREHAVAHADTQVAIVAVHRVVDDGERVARDVGVDVGAVHAEQRARDEASAGWNPGQAGEPGAAQEAHQHGLDLIAARVADEERRGLASGGDAVERGVARVAGGGLERAGAAVDLDGDRHEGAAPLLRQAGDERGVVSGAGAQLVIDVTQGHGAETPGAREGEGGVGERGGVRAAGAGDDDRRGALDRERVERGVDRAPERIGEHAHAHAYHQAARSSGVCGMLPLVMSPRLLLVIALSAGAVSCGPRSAGEPADSVARRHLRGMLQAPSKSVVIRSRTSCDAWTVAVDVSDGTSLEGKLTLAAGTERLEPVERQFAIDELRASVSRIQRDPGGRSVSGGVGASLCVVEEAELHEIGDTCIRVGKDEWVEVWCKDAASCNALAQKTTKEGEPSLPSDVDRPNCFDE